jgi:hypothetical protein
MSTWLYQMSVGESGYTPGCYRTEVWEGEQLNWNIGRCISHGQGKPLAGDLLVLFWTATKNPEPGLYGWGVVTDIDEDGTRVKFRPAPPSDSLKMAPVWDNEVRKLVEKVRSGGNQGTMWDIRPNEFSLVRRKIMRWMRGKA